MSPLWLVDCLLGSGVGGGQSGRKGSPSRPVSWAGLSASLASPGVVSLEVSPDPLRGAVLSAACRDLTSRQHDGLFAMHVFGQESAWNLFKSVAGNLLMGVREGSPGALPVPQTQKPTSHPKIGASVPGPRDTGLAV